MFKVRLRQALLDQAQTGTPTTYKELADRLGLEPPPTIHRLSEAVCTENLVRIAEVTESH
jgi:DNA-binding Lrp family transcriptional regulator